MLNPKEAVEDGYAHNLAILFFAACAVLVTVYFHHDSGLKYWLLTRFGETAPGTVLSVRAVPESSATLENAIRQDRRNTLKNSLDWTSGKILAVEFRPTNALPEIKTFRMPRDFIGSGSAEQVPILYLPRNPKIAYPADHISNFAIDGKILLGALVAGVIIALLSWRSARKWAGYRNRLRRY